MDVVGEREWRESGEKRLKLKEKRECPYRKQA